MWCNVLKTLLEIRFYMNATKVKLRGLCDLGVPGTAVTKQTTQHIIIIIYVDHVQLTHLLLYYYWQFRRIT